MSLRSRAIQKLRVWARQGASSGGGNRRAWLRREMGIAADAELIVIKQYGEYRTGTNALRALLLENFDNVLVLMHMLGDKHGDPIDFGDLGRRMQEDAADPSRAILRASWARPGGVTRPESFGQLAFTSAFAQDVASAIISGSIRFVLSVRHPLGWIEAVMRFWEWPATDTGDAWLDAERVGLARALCQRYNARNLSWCRLMDDLGSRVCVVPFERLEADWRGTVLAVGSAFPLHPRGDFPKSSGRSVQPSAWDNVPPCYGKRKQRHCISQRRVAPPQVNAIVNETIDWGAVARFGYVPGEPRDELCQPAEVIPA